jgi:hypothetical protein
MVTGGLAAGEAGHSLDAGNAVPDFDQALGGPVCRKGSSSLSEVNGIAPSGIPATTSWLVSAVMLFSVSIVNVVIA